MFTLPYMHLYEITTGMVGESYCRAYAWAKDENQALELFFARNPGCDQPDYPVALLTLGDAPFCTVVSDCGFEMPKG